MPELPDIELYLHALDRRVRGQPLEKVRLVSPFLLRTVEPPLSTLHGRKVRELRRLGKRIVFGFEVAKKEEPLFMVLHLMVAGRLQWKEPGAKVPGRVGLCAFDFPEGTLLLTEASKKKRARLHVLRSEAALEEQDPGGLEPLELDLAAFTRAIAENHTLKRTLTDPRIFSGIGNAYSDEILFEAKLPPTRWTTRLDEDEVERLFVATQSVLRRWRDALIAEVGEEWPTKVTAFRPEMAVHGRYGEPCLACGGPIQRIRYADNETNYCPACQNEGKLLADRSLSRLLKGDWPKTLDQLEAMKRERQK